MRKAAEAEVVRKADEDARRAAAEEAVRKAAEAEAARKAAAEAAARKAAEEKAAQEAAAEEAARKARMAAGPPDRQVLDTHLSALLDQMASSRSAAVAPRGTHTNTPKRITGKLPVASPPVFSAEMTEVSPTLQSSSPPVFGADMAETSPTLQSSISPSACGHVFVMSNVMSDASASGTTATQRRNAPPPTPSSPQVVGRSSLHKGHAKISTESVSSHFPSLQTPSPAPKKGDTLEVTL